MKDDAFREHKLTEAIPDAQSDADNPILKGQPEPTDATAAEQRREAQESQQAINAQGGVKDRLVDIGKAHHMGGRSRGRVSDS